MEQTGRLLPESAIKLRKRKESTNRAGKIPRSISRTGLSAVLRGKETNDSGFSDERKRRSEDGCKTFDSLKDRYFTELDV
ncbi:hypothetical protein [Allobaculum sp. Allo2]|uniref:hypothetical protein n=1 Tax=Allobaculum sp. Allo2 TaxID=2853432 RepID=UPI001F5FFCC1|nr:hypothetical protein [Allobaculum sp. Allo2]UNT93294.1 hypothetical protein KWG61_15275 [Allobaculum sp. Allo2]